MNFSDKIYIRCIKQQSQQYLWKSKCFGGLIHASIAYIGLLLKSENNTEVVLSEKAKLMWCSTFQLEYTIE